MARGRQVELSFAGLRDEYASLWRSMEVRADWMPRITASARKILEGREHYDAIEGATGVPWYVVGIVHQMEAGCHFGRHLHNGDSLARRTVQVPKGRPAEKPTGENGCYTWEHSAVDALEIKGWHAIERNAWSLERIAYELERYNGWGYRRYHADVLSPYLWSGTNHYSRGKYVADGAWSPAHVSGQAGAMAILWRLAQLEPSIKLSPAEVEPWREFHATAGSESGSIEHTPIQGMHQSTTGNTAAALGAGGGGTVAIELSTATAKLADKPSPTAWDFLIALASSPTFWIGALTVAGAAYIWLERRRKLITHGI